ncbi:hypothetical protein APUTEX25_000509 [Auxenochlorella protothecoides]|uniref:Uncharacterized protein n=1 Tax=Auxenochlorella protothecoides TaxID=3075 RepID=A0A3M7L0B2_AUXPR|nr:hypothetical protein APUTEX25_000509 [Auxenochlorella protothecoides]|eukprot:RMZ54992.1 hypothetical protein APUTEX25_000509 [Auxenochlorella protothecoides]
MNAKLVTQEDGVPSPYPARIPSITRGNRQRYRACIDIEPNQPATSTVAAVATNGAEGCAWERCCRTIGSKPRL